MNERWELSQVRAVFSRRYLHQNKALEIFFTDRCTPTHTHLEYMYQFYCVLLRLHFFNILEGQLNTQKSDSHYVTFLCVCVCVCVRAASAFLVFASPREVREVVKRLPKVGTGAEYDLPQSRYAKPPPLCLSLSLSSRTTYFL